MVAPAALFVKLGRAYNVNRTAMVTAENSLAFGRYSQCAEHTESKNQVGHGPQGC
jgi:hypothetical protein